MGRGVIYWDDVNLKQDQEVSTRVDLHFARMEVNFQKNHSKN